MANKPTQPLFPLGIETAEQSKLKGILNTDIIEHGPDAIMTVPETKAADGLPSAVRYNSETDDFEGFYEHGGWLPLGGGGVRWEVLPHAPTATLESGRGYLINNTSGASTVVLPLPTRIGDSVTVCDMYGKFSVYPLTIDPNGKAMYGNVEAMTISTDSATATFTWTGDARGWIITAGVGLGQGRVYSRTIYTDTLGFPTSEVTLATQPSIVDVYVDGKRLVESKYSLSGYEVRFSPSLPAGVELQVVQYVPIQLGLGSGGSDSGITPWVYNGGAAVGGETTISVPDLALGVPFITINGYANYPGFAYSYDVGAHVLTFGTPLEAGDMVVLMLSGEVAGNIPVNTSAGFLAIEALRRTYADAGYNLVEGSFGRGGTVSTATDVLLNEVDGKAYSWGGVFPPEGKVIPAGSTPASSGGVVIGAWSRVDDAGLVGGLSKPVTWIGYAGGANPAGTVSSVAAFKSAAAQGSTTHIPKGNYLIDESVDLSNAEWDFAKGAVLNITGGAVVTIGNIKAGIYNIFTGAGSVVFSKENDVVYPEWFITGTDATPGLTKCVDACVPNRVRMHISYPLSLGSEWLINARLPITCNARVTFSPTGGNTKGITVGEGAASWNSHIQLPNVTAFSDFGIRLRGCNLINLEIGAISACGDGLRFETVNAIARQVLDNNVRVQSIQGCTAAFAVTSDDSRNVFQGNEIYCNFIVGCNKAVEYRSSVSMTNFDSNSWVISAIDGAIDGSIGLINSSPSKISKTTFKVTNWCGGFGGSGKLVDGDFNGSDMLFRLNAEIPYSAMNINGSSNRISYLRPGWTSMPIMQCVFTPATALAEFNGGVPVNHDQLRLRLTVPSSIPVGGRVVGYACTPLDDGYSLLFSATPTSPAGMTLEYVRRESKNIVRISWVNQGTAPVAAGALIDFTLNIG